MRITLTPIDGTLPQLLTSKELQAYLRVCRPVAERFGRDCGAERRVGRRKLYDLDVINQKLTEQEAKTEEK